MDVTAQAVMWGTLGAVVYAAPRLLACVIANLKTQHGWIVCAAEAVIALVVGAISAGAVAPWFQGVLFKGGGQETMRVTAAMIGLIANRAAPKIIDGVLERALAVITGRGK
jgi:hypothetical protein